MPAYLSMPDSICLGCNETLEQVLADVTDTRFGVPGAFAIGRCSACGLEQTIPVPAGADLQALYEAYYNFGGESGTRYTALRERFLASGLYWAWQQMDGDISFHTMRGSGRLLDIGCNEGRGLAIYQRNGFEVEGLELNEVAAAEARRQGFTVHSQPIEGFASEHRFDVAVLSNVLEHALAPGEMLTHIHGLLGPGGRVCISCPNSWSWLRLVFGRYWINWHVPFHILHFSPATLRASLERAGFEVIESRQATPALWVAQSLLARLFARPGRPTRQLRQAWLVAPLLLSIRLTLFPLLWLGERLQKGDCLIMVGRKIG